MIASLLARLLGGKAEPLPLSWPERRAALEAARARVAAEAEREKDIARGALAAAHDRERRALGVLDATESALLSDLGREQAARLFAPGSPLRSALAAYRKLGTRVELRALLDVLRTEDERGRAELNVPLEGWCVGLALAVEIVEAGRSDLIGALVERVPSYAGGATSIGERSAVVLRAALHGSGSLLEAERAVGELETAIDRLAAQQHPEPNEAQLALWQAYIATTRQTDRNAAVEAARALRRKAAAQPTEPAPEVRRWPEAPIEV